MNKAIYHHYSPCLEQRAIKTNSKPQFDLDHIDRMNSLKRDVLYAVDALSIKQEIKTGKSDMPRTEQFLRKFFEYAVKPLYKVQMQHTHSPSVITYK